MGQALYRKYRSKSLKEIVGQEHITTTLEQALKQAKISHAYLFTGPRGVGKTSVARILAHEINDLPYTDDSVHMDIIEIDAASNRRIDEIRELRDKVYVAPTSAPYKVYIIDEVHMLTKEAFNALLKTLEEPPAHVVFILATTDAHKLPDTIVSRTQRFTFKPAETEKIVALLSDIAKKEKIKISPKALELLAQHAEGSFRDSVSLLDQLDSHNKQIEIEDVRTLLGVPPTEVVENLVSLLGSSRTNELMTQLNDLFLQGYQPAAIAKQISKILRRQLVDHKLELPSETALEILGRLIEVPASHDPERFLEITLLSTQPTSLVHANTHEAKKEPAAPTKIETKEVKETKKMKGKEPEPKSELKKGQAVDDAASADELDESIWPKVLQTLKQKHNTLYGVVRMAQPSFQDDSTVQLAFAFAFHKKRIEEASNGQKLADIIQELTGKAVKVECVLDKSAKPPKLSEDRPVEIPPDPGLATINNIFGAAELLES